MPLPDELMPQHKVSTIVFVSHPVGLYFNSDSGLHSLGHCTEYCLLRNLVRTTKSGVCHTYMDIPLTKACPSREEFSLGLAKSRSKVITVMKTKAELGQ